MMIAHLHLLVKRGDLKKVLIVGGSNKVSVIGNGMPFTSSIAHLTASGC